MRKIIDSAKDADVSAIIAADVAPMLYARSIGVEVHLSTQLNITNVEALRSTRSSLMSWSWHVS